MQDVDIPAKIPVPWGSAAVPGTIRAIPATSQIGVQDGAASWATGFVPLNLTPVASGGVPPFGQDENGALNLISAWARWLSAGGPVGYDAVFAAGPLGGYPKGAVLSSATLGYFWISTVDNNTTNPDAGGANWSQAFVNLRVNAGNPNGVLAGQAGTASLLPDLVFDTTNGLLWICTTVGNSAAAVWTQIGTPGLFWCGTSTGTANAQAITPPPQLQRLTVGTELSWKVGAGLNNTGPTTLMVASFGTFPVLKDTYTGPLPLAGTELVAGNIASGVFDGVSIHLTSVPFSPGMLGLGEWPTISTSQSVMPGTYFVDTSAGPVTGTLTTTNDRDNYTFIDAQGTWATNLFTVDPGAATIDQVAGTFAMDVDEATFTLYFKGGNGELK